MIQSFITGGVFRFLLRFIPSVFETIAEHVKSKQSIEHDKLKLELAKINAEQMNSDQSIEHDRLKLELAKINAEHMTTVEGIKAEKPVRLARINEHKHKSGVQWVDGFTAVVRPVTTVFWIIFYPLLVWWGVKENFIVQSPLAVLTSFEQEIIACILGFCIPIKSCRRRELEVERGLI
ncbi:hypothetical protein G293_04990 [Candidatus Liberibacter africanus PTSAPSY]|uniref:Uncharacterized protein n=1 Tax=Candidatus Liberibacter africanus PTSAPSY TaxID=1277257 RepID=A0A0G3I7T9_LIBAF|nr:hypothetical protein G293_04990 [Candidatus Liberibacter africanus PTSAPSY]